MSSLNVPQIDLYTDGHSSDPERDLSIGLHGAPPLQDGANDPYFYVLPDMIAGEPVVSKLDLKTLDSGNKITVQGLQHIVLEAASPQGDITTLNLTETPEWRLMEQCTAVANDHLAIAAYPRDVKECITTKVFQLLIDRGHHTEWGDAAAIRTAFDTVTQYVSAQVVDTSRRDVDTIMYH